MDFEDDRQVSSPEIVMVPPKRQKQTHRTTLSQTQQTLDMMFEGGDGPGGHNEARQWCDALRTDRNSAARIRALCGDKAPLRYVLADADKEKAAQLTALCMSEFSYDKERQLRRIIPPNSRSFGAKVGSQYTKQVICL